MGGHNSKKEKYKSNGTKIIEKEKNNIEEKEINNKKKEEIKMKKFE